MRARTQFRITPARIVFRGSNHPWKDLSSKLRKLERSFHPHSFSPLTVSIALLSTFELGVPKSFYNNLSTLHYLSSLCFTESISTHTYVRAHMCRLIRNHIESTLITFDPEHIDLYTLHVPDDPMPALLSRLISNQTVLSPTSLQISSRQTRDRYRQLRYKAIVNATQNAIRLPSVDTQTMINNLLPCRRASRFVFDLPSLANIRTLINGLLNSRPIPRLGLGPRLCCPQLPLLINPNLVPIQDD